MEERILNGRCDVTFAEKERPLTKVLEDQTRVRNIEPAAHDRRAAEVSHVGIECFATRDNEEHAAEHGKAHESMLHEEVDGVHRIDGFEHRWCLYCVVHAQSTKDRKPCNHERTKYTSDTSGAIALNAKESDKNCNCYWNDKRTKLSRYSNLKSFNGRENRNRRRDDAIAIEQCRAEQSHCNDCTDLLVGALALTHQFHQRENATFAFVGKPCNDEQVLDANDQGERPEDQREDAENFGCAWCETVVW